MALKAALQGQWMPRAVVQLHRRVVAAHWQVTGRLQPSAQDSTRPCSSSKYGTRSSCNGLRAFLVCVALFQLLV
jgi:hypothetical protein